MAVSALAGGLTAWSVARINRNDKEIQVVERTVERNPALGTQFTAYEADRYPDLTYAAENAVKAVVNIEAIQEVEMRQRSSVFRGSVITTDARRYRSAGPADLES